MGMLARKLFRPVQPHPKPLHNGRIHCNSDALPLPRYMQWSQHSVFTSVEAAPVLLVVAVN